MEIDLCIFLSLPFSTVADMQGDILSPANVSTNDPKNVTTGTDVTSYPSSDTNTSITSTIVEASFASDFKTFVNDYPQIPGLAITKFLTLLNKHKRTIAEERIPKTYRGLMKTPRSCKVEQVEEKTTFYYFGIQSTLEKYCEVIKELAEIKLGVFVDGVDGDKSTGLVHWPILGKILEIGENLIFPIAIYTGYSKPTCVEQYLRQFVTEINNLCLNGIVIDGKTRKFKLIRILADAPARVLVLNTMGPNAFHHCIYCSVNGENRLNRNHFYETRPSAPRNNEDFINFQYPKLQKGRTPLIDLIDFNVLQQCPYDGMHMFQRLMKTILGFLVDTERNKIRRKRSKLYRLAPASINKISWDLKKMRRNIPVEFQRKTDMLLHFRRWKATQFRFFLLYCSPIVLQKRVHKEVYKNFVLLHFSLRLLSMQDVTPAQMDQVQNYLEEFVHSYAKIFGPEAVTHYVHALLHLVSLVKIHGPIPNFSAYLYESYLGTFKHFEHSARLPGQQIVNRVIERKLSSRELYIKNKRFNKFPNNAEYHDGEFPSNLEKNDFKTYSQINLEKYSIIR